MRNRSNIKVDMELMHMESNLNKLSDKVIHLTKRAESMEKAIGYVLELDIPDNAKEILRLSIL